MQSPELDKRNNTRSGWDLFKGESEWDLVFGQEGWKDVKEKLNSQKFITKILDFFSEELARNGLNVGGQKLVEFDELGANQQCQTLKWSRNHNDEVFTRIEFESPDGSTLRIPHVDHARRLIDAVFFMCDGVDDGIEGGEFGLWEDEEYANDRKPHKCRLVKLLLVKANSMYVFLNANNAFHALTAMTESVGSRRWIYFSISSKYNFWRYDGEGNIIMTKIFDQLRKLSYRWVNR